MGLSDEGSEVEVSCCVDHIKRCLGIGRKRGFSPQAFKGCGGEKTCHGENLEDVLGGLKRDLKTLCDFERSLVRCPTAGVPTYEPCFIINDILAKVCRLERQIELRKGPGEVLAEFSERLKKEAQMYELVRGLRATLAREAECETRTRGKGSNAERLAASLGELETELYKSLKSLYLESSAVRKKGCFCGQGKPPPVFRPSQCPCTNGKPPPRTQGEKEEAKGDWVKGELEGRRKARESSSEEAGLDGDRKLSPKESCECWRRSVEVEFLDPLSSLKTGKGCPAVEGMLSLLRPTAKRKPPGGCWCGGKEEEGKRSRGKEEEGKRSRGKKKEEERSKEVAKVTFAPPPPPPPPPRLALESAVPKAPLEQAEAPAAPTGSEPTAPKIESVVPLLSNVDDLSAHTDRNQISLLRKSIAGLGFDLRGMSLVYTKETQRSEGPEGWEEWAEEDLDDCWERGGSFYRELPGATLDSTVQEGPDGAYRLTMKFENRDPDESHLPVNYNESEDPLAGAEEDVKAMSKVWYDSAKEICQKFLESHLSLIGGKQNDEVTPDTLVDKTRNN